MIGYVRFEPTVRLGLADASSPWDALIRRHTHRLCMSSPVDVGHTQVRQAAQPRIARAGIVIVIDGNDLVAEQALDTPLVEVAPRKRLGAVTLPQPPPDEVIE